ncbi:neutral zinc metallopeptidase [Crenothrix sp.]|uniref:KPN_02809 family neutral zinc metallopeptidase n=1 Tax=Crenothrix sp. TaxID=3100433 RepID=UPI00374D1119
MRQDNERESDNIEDRRGMSMGGKMLTGGGLGTVALAVIALFMGVDPSIVLSVLGDNILAPQQQTRQAVPSNPQDEKLKKFMSVVLASTEDAWGDIFQKSGSRYVPPKLVLYSGQIESACGFGEAAMGPFYCPGDQKLYLDMDFFNELANRHNAPGDFAQAYVVAHEVGHHVQKLLGTADQVQQAMQRGNEVSNNQLQVRMELQADCYAGVWANHANEMRQILEPGDIEEALGAASSVGDDILQKQTRGYVVPESFTHGSSAQRMQWFGIGAKTGDPKKCNTFSAR